MRNSYYLVGLLLFYFTISSFVDDNPYFQITREDVKFNIPKGFPKLNYDLKKNPITPEGFVLGRMLFHDPILSLDSSTSCASCHQRFAAFGHIDHQLSHGINALIGKRNVPSIQNVAWQNSFMWDGGVNHLDLFPLAPITNPVEMGESLEHVLEKLKRSKKYQSQFNAAFPGDEITSEKMLKAISQFLCLMTSSNSRYDNFRLGKDTLAKQEMDGLVLFRNKCSSCHTEPLFTDYSFRNIGLVMDTALQDSGRAGITGLPLDRMKFKVPSLRNIEMTPPYMHDGRFRNLHQALDHYSKGNYAGTNVDQNVFLIGGLSRNQKADLIAFLKTLTDKTFLYDRRFADPNLK